MRMIHIRSAEEIRRFRACGAVNRWVHSNIYKALQPGVTTRELDEIAARVLAEAGATSSIREPQGFPGHVCISINDEVGHGVPGTRAIVPGDLVKVDVSVCYAGVHTDAAVTHQVGAGVQTAEFLRQAVLLRQAAQNALWAGIAQARAGKRCSDISSAIQSVVRTHGLMVVRRAFGHGVGTDLHEEPAIANFGPPGTGPVLRPGMVVAIEPVVSAGSRLTYRKPDGWTDATVDGSLAAHFEHTVVITDRDPEIVTFDADVPGLGKADDGLSQAPIVMRPMRRDDENRLLHLAAREMDAILMKAWGRRVNPAEIFDPEATIEVLEDGSGRLVGFFAYSQPATALHLNTIVIDAKFQGQGFGGRVMKRLEEIARQKGLHAITLHVQKNNERAIRFYRRLGYRDRGTAYANTLRMSKAIWKE